MSTNYVALRIRATDEARPDLDELKLKLDELKDRVAVARAEVDSAGADVQLADLEAKLEMVSKKVASPKIDVAGASRAAASITAVEGSMDELDAKAVESAAIQKKAAEDAAAANEAAAAKSAESGGLMAGAGEKVKMALLGVGIGAAAAVYEAGKFQDSTTHLVTDAGESAKNLGMVQQGILSVSDATGTSAASITDAMYHIESGGYHGAAGLKLLKIAAEGARVGGADLDTVSKTLVGTMNAYGAGAGKATSYMNQMIATVGAGDMRMQDLASSLSAVAPLAAAVGIKFSQVGGAIATMTAQGMSAQQATQDLANTIRSLSNPNNVAINEMNQLGLNSQDVAKHLGQRGLTGTISMLTSAITRHMGKSGMVIQSAFNSATNAAKDANVEISAMPASLQKLAKGFLSGSVSSKAWKADLQGMSPVQAHLMAQFATTAEKAHSFNSLLTAGSPAAQTYTAALAKMMGGATGLNTALMLSGSRQAVFAANTAAVAAAAKKGGDQVSNWKTIQATFNFQLDQAKTSVVNMGISLGSALLPAVSAVLGPLSHMLSVIAGNKAASIALAVVIGAVLAGAIGTKAVGALKDFKGALKSAADGVQWLTGKLTAQKSAQEGAAAAAKASAAAQEAASGEAAAAAETDAAETAAANEEAAAASSGSWITAAGRQIAAAAGAAAQSAAKAAAAVASNVAGAATAAGAWIAAGAQQAAAAAVWVAEGAMKVAAYVAENVFGAQASETAWTLANAVMLLGIGLVVAAVVIAVVEIVKHWKSIVHGVEEAFDAVVHAVSKAVTFVVKFVKSHWELLLAILLGPIAVAVLEIAKHWDTIRRDAARFAGDVVRTVSRLASDVAGWFERMFEMLIGTEIRGAEVIVHWFESMFDRFISAEARGIDGIVSFFRTLPGRILSIIEGLGTDLFGAGARVVQFLANGIMSGIGAVTHAVSSVVDEVKSFLPFSPAKKGPLSGSGAPDRSGASIARMLAQGITGGRGGVASAMDGLTRSAGLSGRSLGPAGGGYGGGGGQQLEITLRIEKTGDRLMDEIVDGLKVEVRSKGGGGPYSVQRALGRVWPE